MAHKHAELIKTFREVYKGYISQGRNNVNIDRNRIYFRLKTMDIFKNLESQYSTQELLKVISDVQYAIEDLWRYEEDIHAATGIDIDKCKELLNSINIFCSIKIK